MNQTLMETAAFVECDIYAFIGKTVSEVDMIESPVSFTFHFTNGSSLLMHHVQEDDEVVLLDGIDGDLMDLINKQVIDTQVSFHAMYTESGTSDTRVLFTIRTGSAAVTIRFKGYGTVRLNDTVMLLQTPPGAA